MKEKDLLKEFKNMKASLEKSLWFFLFSLMIITMVIGFNFHSVAMPLGNPYQIGAAVVLIVLSVLFALISLIKLSMVDNNIPNVISNSEGSDEAGLDGAGTDKL